MVYLLRPLIDGLEKEVKTDGWGVCQLCGRETDVVVSGIEKWLKGQKNPGIFKSISKPVVCKDCAQVLVSAVRPSALSKKYNGASVFISGYGEKGVVAEGWLFESLEEFRERLSSYGKGLYSILFFLKKGNFLPIVDLVNLEATSNPSVSLTVNVVVGSNMYAVYWPTELVLREEPEGLIKVFHKRILGR